MSAALLLRGAARRTARSLLLTGRPATPFLAAAAATRAPTSHAENTNTFIKEVRGEGRGGHSEERGGKGGARIEREREREKRAASPAPIGRRCATSPLLFNLGPRSSLSLSLSLPP